MMKGHNLEPMVGRDSSLAAELEVDIVTALERPKRYKVILVNDDYTPMEFVVHVLITFFHLNEVRATHVMFDVHTKGRGICGVYTREIAETKVAQVNTYSHSSEHPLLCEMEPE